MGLIKKLVDYLTSDGTKPLPPETGRNEPCWCGSGKKYKKCHFEQDEKRRYEAAMCKCVGSS